MTLRTNTPLLICAAVIGCSVWDPIEYEPSTTSSRATIAEAFTAKQDLAGRSQMNVYGGRQRVNLTSVVDQHHFSYVMHGSIMQNQLDLIPNKRLALLWTGIATGVPESNWSRQKSPYDNSLADYTAMWTRRMRNYATNIAQESDFPDVGVCVLDIEKAYNSDTSIEKFVTTYVGFTSTDSAIRDYKNRMVDMYSLPLKWATTHLDTNSTLFSSYGDVPVRRTWYALSSFKDSTPPRENFDISYLYLDDKDRLTKFAQGLDFASVSAYAIKNSPRTLSYCLAQIEINEKLTNRPIITFVSPRYQSDGLQNLPIPTTTAFSIAALAPFFGSNGLWIYDNAIMRASTNTDADSTYGSIFRGLHYVHKYQRFYDSKMSKIIISASATISFQNKLPIWVTSRRQDEALVIAINPFATKSDSTELLVPIHGSDSISLTLLGNSVLTKLVTLN